MNNDLLIYSKKDKLKDDYEKQLVSEILDDFKSRQNERKSFEGKWQMNINFFIGNQYCNLTPKGEIVDNYKQYFWEEREVYNHIAPIVELRLSKLSRVRPSLTVVPFSDDQIDVNCAKVSKNILTSVSHSLNTSNLIQQATLWSEICGTAFYKVGWNTNKGRIIGKNENGRIIREGDVDISVVSPFEIYPDSNAYANIDDCNSIIYAKAVHKDTIKNIWGVDVDGQDINVFTLDAIDNMGGLGYLGTASSVGKVVKKNHVLVLEKYEAPTIEYPNGRLIIIAGDKLVYIGELPYINMEDGKRGFPFIKQTSITVLNSFWGMSVIERCIPIQRSFNAIKNRKHEFLNRLSMGVLAIEDGSIDTENLEEEGLSPGKVLVYRQGASAPHLLSSGSVPLDFQYEENQLQNEFLKVSGVSDLINASSITSNISGVALQLLIEQDEVRLLSSAENIRTCAKEMAKHILRLFKQFAQISHTSRIVGENGDVEVFYWNSSDIRSEDVIFETENEINETLAQRRSMIYDLLNYGLLHDEDGKLSNAMRQKVLEQLGFGVWDSSKDVKALQIANAERENLILMETGKLDLPKEIDDHDLHIDEHTCFMLTPEFNKKENNKIQEKMLEHIREHKKIKELTKQIGNEDTIKLNNN